MAKVLGVGGIFFRARDPGKLSNWYQEVLGMPVSDGNYAALMPSTMPAGSMTVWSPFPSDTEYFQPSGREFMFNLVVDDLDEALRQVRNAGAETVGEVEDYDYGRFGWFLDPEGNKVELWQPKVVDG